MHHWLVAFPRSSRARENGRQRMRRHVLSRLTFNPEAILLEELPDGALVFSASAVGAVLGSLRPYHLEPGGFCLVGGLPSLEAYSDDPREEVVPAIHRLLSRHDPQDLFLNLRGNWNIGRSERDRFFAFSSFSGRNGCFYRLNEDFFAIGTRASLVALFQSRSTEPSYNLHALSWIFSTTTILGAETAYSGVFKLKPGWLLTYDGERGASQTEFTVSFHTPYPSPDLRDREHLFAGILDRLVRRIRWWSGRGLRLSAHLTGDKDSRVVYGLLLGSGVLERIERGVTNGAEDSGDVIVARRIAAETGLGEKHVLREHSKKSYRELGEEAVRRRFFYAPFKYDCQVTPFDGPEDPVLRPEEEVFLTGGGGEIYRQRGGMLPHDPERTIEKVLKVHFNKLRLLTEEAVRF